MILFLENTTEWEFIDWLKPKAAKFGLFVDSFDQMFGGGDNFKNIDSINDDDWSSSLEVRFFGIDPERFTEGEGNHENIPMEVPISFVLDSAGTNLQVNPKAKTLRGKDVLSPILLEIAQQWPNNRDVISVVLSHNEKLQLFITENDEEERIKGIVRKAKKLHQEGNRITWREVAYKLDISERTLRSYRKDPRYK